MKEFLKTNTITYNLMSFTGFKSILVFSLLLEGPKSYNDLKYIFRTHEYLKEDVSIDTLRIYMNSLKKIGCKIRRTTAEDGTAKYSISSHPFSLKISAAQAKSIIKVYKAISKTIDVNDLLALQQFFDKISVYVSDQKLKDRLNNLSPLNHINQKLLNELKHYAQINAEITIYYNSLYSRKKNITVVADKIMISNGKLYLCGFNSEYNNYSSFLVTRIIGIVSVNLEHKTLAVPEITAGYELKKDNIKPELFENEKIISEDDNKYVIEITSKNKFEIIQRVMSYTNRCKVLYPDSVKEEVISNLKKMKEGYIEQEQH